MKTNRTARTFLTLILTLTTLFAAGSALAWGHGPRVSIGIGFGAPYYPYYYRPYPYYYPPYAYYPAPVIVQQQPVYVEQNAPQPQSQPQAQPQAPSGYWYFCAEQNGYYPYVKECQTGWQRVAPQPAN